jgi:hypothetical protein
MLIDMEYIFNKANKCEFNKKKKKLKTIHLISFNLININLFHNYIYIKYIDDHGDVEMDVRFLLQMIWISPTNAHIKPLIFIN